MRTHFFIVLTIIVCTRLSSFAQFTVNAGPDVMLCPGTPDTIGGNPTAFGGQAPYTYSWSPTTFLNSSTVANPISSAIYYIEYTVTVTDDTGAVKTDKVIVYPNNVISINAGNDISICENQSTILGGSNNIVYPGITYSWSPGNLLNDSTLPKPTASPGLTSTTFTLTATPTGCPPKTDQVFVRVIPTPNIDAGPDTTINEGQRVTLQGSGGNFYVWSPTNTLTYYYTANPDAEPKVSTTYTLYGTDPSNTCPAWDTVRVTVIKSDEVVIYNTFTPNGDGNNDTWYIGNLQKYPNNIVELYNRYGKIVYRTTSYPGNFDGRVSGQELPAATYFYIVYLGDDENTKFQGTLTIVR